ncbi:MAG: crossover junction endodeoxyribonuclease RuvC [bacterium]
MRVLGVDTSLRCTGYGVVDAKGSRMTVVEQGTIATPASQSHSRCLNHIDVEIRRIVERTRPDAVSIEGIFFCKNVKTAVVLGEARGVVIAACAASGVPVYEYAPRRMKQALVGFGGADKSQVGKMMAAMLGLAELPEENAADALAMAICHANSVSRVTALSPKAL